MTGRRKPIDHWRESVWNAPDLGPLEKLLLLALTRWMDVDTLGGCRPGHAAIMRRTSMSKRTVERTIASVRGKGWLIEDHHGGSERGSERLASVYRGSHPDWRQSDTSPPEQTGVRVTPVLASESPTTGVRVTPHPSGTRAAGSGAGAPSPGDEPESVARRAGEYMCQSGCGALVTVDDETAIRHGEHQWSHAACHARRGQTGTGPADQGPTGAGTGHPITEDDI